MAMIFVGFGWWDVKSKLGTPSMGVSVCVSVCASVGG